MIPAQISGALFITAPDDEVLPWRENAGASLKAALR